MTNHKCFVTVVNGLYITDILKLRSVMITSVTSEDKSKEDDDLFYAREYLDINIIPKSEYAKRLRVRRLICRVCKMKFRTRQEAQTHIKAEHRRLQTGR